jgi:hypothetical protein
VGIRDLQVGDADLQVEVSRPLGGAEGDLVGPSERTASTPGHQPVVAAGLLDGSGVASKQQRLEVLGPGQTRQDTEEENQRDQTAGTTVSNR